MNNACYKSSTLFKLLIVANSVVHVNAPSIPISITKHFLFLLVGVEENHPNGRGCWNAKKLCY